MRTLVQLLGRAPRMRSRGGPIALVVLALAAVGLVTAGIATALTLRSTATVTGDLTFTWSMADRFGDLNGDGVVEERTDAADLKPSTYSTTFDSCSSPAAKSAPSDAKYDWTWTRGTTTVTRPGVACKVT